MMTKMMKTTILKLTERQIARTCGDYLALDGWRLIWCEPVSRREWGRGFGEKGMADLLAIRYDGMDNVLEFCEPQDDATEICIQALCQVIWIEWKTATGKLATHQSKWHIAERARGALTLIAGEDFEASIDGFLAWYRGSGMNRGRI